MKKFPQEIIDKIFIYTDLEFCLKVFPENKYIINKLYHPYIHTMDTSAWCGDLETCKYLYNNGHKFSHKTMNFAAQNRQLETLKWLHIKGCKHTNDAIEFALFYKHLEIVKFLES